MLLVWPPKSSIPTTLPRYNLLKSPLDSEEYLTGQMTAY